MRKFRQIFTLVVVFYLSLITSADSKGDNFVLNVAAVGPKTEMVDAGQYSRLIYVSIESGSDKSGDGSKSNPYKTLFSALSRTEMASTESKIAVLVASGTYTNGTLIMKEYVDLFGGFDPQTWNRDIDNNQTVLDGDGARRVVLAASHARLDGFIVTNGLSASDGGGILCDDTSPLISNNYIINNAVLEPPDFNHQRIHQEGNHGGGIACLFNAVPEIRNNIFYRNRTFIGTGAGVVFYGWVRIPGAPKTSVEKNVIHGGVSARLANNVFVGNISGVNDLHRTRSSSGGAIACAYEARPVIVNNVILNNEAKGRSDAGGIYSEYFSHPLIRGNWVLGNISDDDGGGFYTMKLGNPVLEKNIFAGNWTHGGGSGGIRLSKEGRARLTDNVVVDNPGGGITCVDSYMELENNIIMKNPGARGVSYSNVYSYMQASIVRNNIIRENEKGAFVVTNNAGPDPVFENNNVDDQGVNQGKQNFDQSPEFKNDGFTGAIKEVIFDRLRVQSRIIISTSLSGDQDLAGRIIRTGERWGVIIAYSDNVFTIWGDLYISDKQEMTYEVLPSYTKP